MFASALVSWIVLGTIPGLPSDTAERVRSEFHVRAFALEALELPPEGGAGFTVDVPLRGSVRRLVLTHHSVRAADFELLVEQRPGVIVNVEPEPPVTYRGHLAGEPGSVVAGSMHGGQLTALVQFPDGTRDTIQPLTDVEPGADASLHVVFSDRDVVPGNWQCGNLELNRTSPPGGVAGGTGMKVCDVAFDADHEFFKKNHDSVADTMRDIENVMVGIETAYERDTGITYEVTVILVRASEPDPYFATDSGTMLGEFQNGWNANHGGIRRDTAHLMTGKNLDGNIIGLAYLTVICNLPWAYGLSQSRFTQDYASRVALTAHELGHNWNAGHCDGDGDCHIMCSGIGGCNGLGLPNFGVNEQAVISAYKDAVGCLLEEQPPVPLPFFASFPEQFFDPALWSYNFKAVVVQSSSNPPSPPWTIELNATGPGDNRDDDLRTNFMLLGAVPQARLSFYTEHRGVEAGEQLVVEYRASTLEWREIFRVTSDGVSQDQFQLHAQILPDDAYHDEFRVRFRPEVDETNDSWFVDDILVTPASCPDPVHYGLPTAGSGGVTPKISWSGGVPFAGNEDFHLVGTELFGGQTGFLFVGFTKITADLGQGAYLNVAPPWIVAQFTVGGLPLPGLGTADIPAPIPGDPALDGVHFYCQFMCTDQGGPLGLIGTDGLDAVICY